jgi:hypothetical protein
MPLHQLKFRLKGISISLDEIIFKYSYTLVKHHKITVQASFHLIKELSTSDPLMKLYWSTITLKLIEYS